MKKISKYIVRVLSFVLILATFWGVSAETVHGAVKFINGLRPVFAQPNAVQHEPTFVYSKSPFLRIPQIAYEAPDPNEAEYGEPVAEGENETVYQTGEDSYKTVIETVPHAYTDENGNLVPIDNTLALTTDGNGNEILTNTSNSLNIEMPTVIEEGNGVSVAVGNSQVRLIPLEGDYTRAAAQGDSVLYNDVFPGIDVQYTAHEVALKEFIILRTPSKKHTFQYRLEAPGLEVWAVDGAINLYYPGETMPTFTVAAPFMFDAAGTYSFDVNITLEGDIVSVSADVAWLTAPERVYPIEIDPSVVETKRATASMFTVANNFYQDSVGYSMAGYIPKNDAGYPGDPNWGSARAFFYFDNALDDIPTDAVIEEARFVLNQYGTINGSGNSFQISQIDSPASFADIDAHPNYSNHWDYVVDIRSHVLSTFASEVKTHSFEITDTVSNWLSGDEINYGLMVSAVDFGTPPAALFYSPAVGGTKPQLEIDWRENGSISPGYGIDATTIHVRPIAKSGNGGQLDFYGVFWDGIATPGSDVNYTLNGATSDPYNGTGTAVAMPEYPNTSSYELLSGYPDGGTMFRRKISNWQTEAPFTAWKLDTLYTLTAYAETGTAQGVSVTSESFIIYKVKQFDTLTSIANWYGVPYDTLAKDNRIVDRLLVEGNTIFIRNPQRNATTPYNPADLSEDAKKEIDGLLMGRGLHCEFGYEPINLNTGNFIFEAIDVSAEDFGDTVTFTRFYNSKEAGTNSSFGRGWSFNWDERLSALADDTIVFARGDGSVLRFKPDSGGYVGPAGYGLALVRTKTGEKTVDFSPEDLDDDDYSEPESNTVTEPIYEYIITDMDGTVKNFNSFGLLVQSQDINGFVTNFEYNAEFMLTAIVVPSGLRYGFVTDAIGRITEINLPGSNQVRYTYDAQGNLVSYIDATGKETTYSYNSVHLMTSWTDANGTKIIENEYDSEGRVTKQTDARGEVVSFAYAEGKTSITDMRGFTTTYHFDAQYRTTKIEYSDGTNIEKGYNAQNLLAFEVNELGQRTEYSYDSSGNRTKVLRYNGSEQICIYDDSNRQIQFTDWDGATTKYVYNAAGDLEKVIFPDGSENSYTYDAEHRMRTEMDALGNITRYEWNGALISAEIDPIGNRTEYYHDSFGRQTSMIDAEMKIP